MRTMYLALALADLDGLIDSFLSAGFATVPAPAAVATTRTTAE